MTESEQSKPMFTNFRYASDKETESRKRAIEGENITVTAPLGTWMRVVGAVIEMKEAALHSGLTQEAVDVIFPSLFLIRQLTRHPAARNLIQLMEEQYERDNGKETRSEEKE